MNSNERDRMFTKILVLITLTLGLSDANACYGCGPKDPEDYFKPVGCPTNEWVVTINKENTSDKAGIVDALGVISSNYQTVAVSHIFTRDQEIIVQLNRTESSQKLTKEEVDATILKMDKEFKKIKGTHFMCSLPVPAMPRGSGSN